MVTLDDKDLPILDRNTYVKETALALWYALPRVLLAGFLFSLVSLPAISLGLVIGFLIPGILLGAVTLGPGWLAMCAVIARSILREPDPSIWDFFRDFGHFFLRGAMLGGLVALPLLAGIGTAPLLQLDTIPTVAWVGLSADLAALIFLASLYLYVCPQIVMYEVGVRLAMRNGMLLGARHLSNTLGLISLEVLLGFLAFKVSLLLLVILPGCWLVFVINNLRLVLRLESGHLEEK
jgi:uncharacterized membrane protein YesL